MKTRKQFWKWFMRPYGPCMIVGTIVLLICVILLAIAYCDPNYSKLSPTQKDTNASGWAALYAFGFILILLGLPTTPSKK